MADYIERKLLYELAYWHGEHPDVGNPYGDGVDAVDISDIEKIPAADVWRWCAARTASGLRITMVESGMAVKCFMSFGLPQRTHLNRTIFAATENGGKSNADMGRQHADEHEKG